MVDGTRYYPAPAPIRLEDLQYFLSDELNKISSSIDFIAAGNLPTLHNEPGRPRDGNIVLADGTDWNPGSGVGVYCYYNSTWNALFDPSSASTPAFHAYMSTAELNIPNDLTPVLLSMDTEIFDQGSNFNTTTYQFTAPVTGNYMIGCTVRLLDIDPAATWYQVYIVTSNRTHSHMFAPKVTSDLTWDGSGGEELHELDVSELCDMDANDTCEIRVVQSGGTSQTDVPAIYSKFWGYLVA